MSACFCVCVIFILLGPKACFGVFGPSSISSDLRLRAACGAMRDLELEETLQWVVFQQTTRHWCIFGVVKLEELNEFDNSGHVERSG